ncbi:hypothetical protein FPSE_10893 [Fusarium pseudograminearum CS3096]|uniref:Rhodopsin domain-containing protein n=1 Tax=Fusarium pseudograminearum (strain CS3096) TaxID=1028729 RepID=K3VA36_FUSPC|nr:hypothetical protein FPSE_10893 [Fusarium pseudograminearum CS3096]EKJ68968.1 hypothetical protein FPSE_10893 [Fusarium pseudograminearum CS3096]
MKVATSIQLFILSSLISFNAAVASVPTNATELEDAPECAIQCLAQLVKGPTLSDKNKDILCHNKAIGNGAAGCTLVQCSMRDLFGTPIRHDIYTGRSQSWGPDDVTIIAAAAFSVLSTLMTGLMTFKGLGRNVWLFDDYTITTFYIYLRRTPTTACIFTVGGMERVATEGDFLEYSGNHILACCRQYCLGCLDVCSSSDPAVSFGVEAKEESWGHAYFRCWNLSSLIAASCIRIPYLIGFSRSLNSTADSQGFIVWSNIECGIGILVACMPHMQPVFRAIAERARSWKVLPTSSNGGDGMFVQRGLKTIPITNAGGNDMRTDGTTLVGGDDTTPNDSGGLLTLEGSTIYGKRNGGSVSDGPKMVYLGEYIVRWAAERVSDVVEGIVPLELLAVFIVDIIERYRNSWEQDRCIPSMIGAADGCFDVLC